MARLPQYLNGLRKLDVPPPFVVMLTLEGIRDSVLVETHDDLYEADKISLDALELPPVAIEGYGSAEDYRRAMRPVFDALWNAGGRERCTYFSEDGAWQPSTG